MPPNTMLWLHSTCLHSPDRAKDYLTLNDLQQASRCARVGLNKHLDQDLDLANHITLLATTPLHGSDTPV